jgi:hypothetical protein
MHALARKLLAGSRRGASLLVAKAIMADLAGQLPNCRLQSESDICLLEEFEAKYHHEAIEFWLCATDFENARPPIAGRIMFDSGSAVGQVLECVWNASPRLIESLGREREITFARARRKGWGYPFRLECLEAAPAEQASSIGMQGELAEVIRRIEGRRERIQGFLEEIEALGIEDYSLEFKVVGSQVEIIDWDSTNDAIVLASPILSLLSRE